MPEAIPDSLDNWWCSMTGEYAFVGFSYEVSACQSLEQLKSEFHNMRESFNARYVRLYGACDDNGFYDNVVEAAWDAGLGVHALVWFGFDNDDMWKTRRDSLFRTLHANEKAKFVTRAVQFGSEPLFDGVLSVDDLASQVAAAHENLSPLGIPVTISEMAYGFMENADAIPIFDAVDLVDAHMLPFFSQQASTGGAAWPIVMSDISYFHAGGKKIYLTENGWPSETSDGVQPNSPDAVANVENEAAYFNLLDDSCPFFKQNDIGWFAHIYSDNQEPGYGILDENGSPKFLFSPKTNC
ncbi:glycoside hydrolase [Fistulina hepatica ATCC 64428]|uniref:glucan endo-1,3-beta-D-glucosidase n=1 Tax=Fistulina hepatica ATCC 64428 TaxID=1128425 RepID=A0A0D7A8K8_9AGAR|nr:glycoside hydrolase [Fistulina hepatica ATCC 64428]